MTDPDHFPTSKEVEEVTKGDFGQVQPPAEAWGVSEADMAAADAETLAISDKPQIVTSDELPVDFML